MRLPVASTLALVVAVPLIAGAGPQPPAGGGNAWSGCCGLTPWPRAGAMNVAPPASGGGLGGFGYLPEGSSLRHTLGLTGQIPAPYATLKNPLPPTSENAQKGAAIFNADCAACHGVTGLADDPAARKLKPPPAQLGWLTKIPPGNRDAFMYWSIAEGGVKFSSDMPAYKDKLTDEQIWSVIGYIRARLPHTAAATR